MQRQMAWLNLWLNDRQRSVGPGIHCCAVCILCGWHSLLLHLLWSTRLPGKKQRPCGFLAPLFEGNSRTYYIIYPSIPPPKSGLPIKIHRSSKRPRKTTLWLKDTDTLVWASKRAIGPKQWHKLHLSGVTSVQVCLFRKHTHTVSML